ncbi:MAG: CHAT domain-containing protein, partial [Moorea sp. SIO2I5]|nr:CHAT domain-containing protein [Moorena sp. SIO2I5]
EAKETGYNQQTLKKVRQVIESLHLTELNNFRKIVPLNPNLIQVDQIDFQAAVIYPIILDDRLEVILHLPGQPLQHYSTPLSAEEIEQTLSEMESLQLSKNFIETRSSSRLSKLSEKVYTWLIKPAETKLAKSSVKTLVFVPNSGLRNISIAALHDGEQYLVEKYAIAITPALERLEPQPQVKRPLKALIIGVSETRRDFPPLTGVEQEVAQIGSIISGSLSLNSSSVVIPDNSTTITSIREGGSLIIRGVSIDITDRGSIDITDGGSIVIPDNSTTIASIGEGGSRSIREVGEGGSIDITVGSSISGSLSLNSSSVVIPDNSTTITRIREGGSRTITDRGSIDITDRDSIDITDRGSIDITDGNGGSIDLIPNLLYQGYIQKNTKSLPRADLDLFCNQPIITGFGIREGGSITIEAIKTIKRVSRKIEATETIKVKAVDDIDISHYSDLPIVHVASHKIRAKNFEKLLRSREQEKLNPIELLVLSADQSAQGNNQTPFGLAGLALKSRVRSILGALISTKDE